MDEDLLQNFLDESSELVDEIEPTLITLQTQGEQQEVDLEQVNALFRLFHTLKGCAGFLNLDRITQVTHEAENLLDQVRTGQRPYTPQLTELLVQTIDLIRRLLAGIQDTGRDDQCCEDDVQSMTTTLANEAGSPPSRSPMAAAQPPPPAPPGPGPSTQSEESAVLGEEIAQELRQRFLLEAEEQVDGIEQALLEANRNPAASGDQLKVAFRAMHSLKGNCGIMGLADLERLTHRAETVLDALRSGSAPRPQRSIEDLLSVIDILRGGLQRFAADGKGGIDGIDAFVDILGDSLLPGPGQAAHPTPAGSATSAITASQTRPASPVRPGSGQTIRKAATRRISTEAIRAEGGPAETEGRRDVRVDLSKLDALINLVGELVLAENMVTLHPAIAGHDDENLQRAVHQLRRVASELQDIAMAVRMIPLSGAFRKMLRVVHDVSKRCGKNAKLVLIGEETEVDKTVIEKISDPLVHIVRNAIDHGIETPEERRAAGKPEQGTVTIEARHEAGEVWILIKDDGKGLHRGKLLEKAAERGLVGAEAADWPDNKVFSLILEPGFSTAAQVTDVSGRGVGMDVVKRNIERLKGRIDISSRPGEGSTILLRLPLTLAIIDGLVVRVGSQRYILPILSVQEVFQVEATHITHGPDGDEVVRVREDLYPAIHLAEVLGREGDAKRLEDGTLVLVECDGQRHCFLVDELLGQQETVIKGLSDYLGEARGVAGCTILGDGSVALILDIPGVLNLAAEATPAVSQR